MIVEALKALADGTPRLMFLGPPEELDVHRRKGVVTVPIQCQSEGALEVYVEPVLPRPNVIVIGGSPAAGALARMATALGWRATLVDDRGSPADHPGVDRVVPTLDLQAAGVDEDSFVVVATQGHYDEEALERALTDAGPLHRPGRVEETRRHRARVPARSGSLPTTSSRGSRRRRDSISGMCPSTSLPRIATAISSDPETL